MQQRQLRHRPAECIDKFKNRLSGKTPVSYTHLSVIATGGGAVLNPDNIRLLKENGTVIFIDRPLEKLVTTADRPLSSNKELLEKRYKERYGLYCAAADVKIDAVSRIEQNVKNIEEVFLNENSCN